MKDGHCIKGCNSKSSCQKCEKKHHTLLHRDEPNSPKFSVNGVISDKAKFSGHQREAKYTTLLPTAIVSVINSHNELVQCRALLDCGSQLSFVTQHLAKQLNLNQTKVQLNLSGIGGKANDVKAGREPDFHLAKLVDMILGADVFEELIENQREEISPRLFLKTTFGWIILGKQPGINDGFASCHFSLDETVRKFWEIESLPQ